MPYLHLSFCHTQKIIRHTDFLFNFTLFTRKKKNMYLPSTVPKNSPWSESVIISSLPTKNNTCHKSLKQEPFVLNFLQISYIHSRHLRFHSNVPLSFPTHILEHWDDCNTQINIEEGESHTSVSRFVTSIVGWFALCFVSKPWLFIN